MTKFWGKNKIKEAGSLFVQRTKFKQQAYEELDDSLKNSTIRDFNYANYSLYGRISPDEIVHIPKHSVLSQIRTEDGRESVRAVDFVARAFNDLKNFFDKKLGSGKIPNSQNYITKIDSVRGYRDPMVDYYEYAIGIINNFSGPFLYDKKHKIKTFSDYALQFIEYIKKISRAFPFTFGSWYTSNHSSPFYSGLFIDIKGTPIDDDSAKETDFLIKNNFDFYVNACNQFGFMIHQNAPHILVANLSSPMMRHYSNNILSSVGDYFNFMCIPTHISELDILENILMEGYSNFVYGNPHYKEVGVCKKNKLYEKIRFRDKADGFKIDIYNIIKLYIIIKNIENNNIFTEGDIYKMIKKAYYYQKRFDKNKAMNYINNEFKVLKRYEDGSNEFYRKKAMANREKSTGQYIKTGKDENNGGY